MYRNVCLFSLLLCAFLSLHGSVMAEIVMTEVYPAPTSGYEWVELCNTGPEPISLATYSLSDSSGKKLIVPSLILAPQQYVLATSSGVLNNAGDSIMLAKNNVIIQDMIYDISMSSEYSLVSCNQNWTKTLLITPGYDNVPCTSPITSTPIPTLLTPTITVSIQTNSPPQTPTPPIALVISEVPTPTLPKPISFQKHHAPRVLGATTTPIPKITKATNIIRPHASTAPATYHPSRRGLGMLVATGGVVASLLIIYNILERSKIAYNEKHDESETSEGG